MPRVELLPPHIPFLKEHRLDHFHEVMSLAGGESYKKNIHRSVDKFSLPSPQGPLTFFLKRHYWPEIKDKVRDLLSFKWPKSDGKQEWVNIQAVANLGIATLKPMAWGEATRGFFRRQSFLITESLGNLERLENYVVRCYAGKNFSNKRKHKLALILQTAHLARTLHQAHLYHRDFYCGHILLKGDGAVPPELCLIDLQRVRHFTFRPRRWQTKDLAALHYTADPRAISLTDRLRFFYVYLGLPLMPRPHLSAPQKRWIRRILRRSAKIARHTAKKCLCHQAKSNGVLV